MPPALTPLVALGWAATLAMLLDDRRRQADAAAEPEAVPGPLVSVIVPARDEERAIGATVRALREQRYGRIEVVVVDDESRDDTGAEARAAAGADPRVRVIAGAPVPAGWVGKSWACWQGYGASSGDWLLFTDADVVHAPDALGRCLALAERLGQGGLTLVPRVDAVGPVERAVLPAAVALIAAFVAPGPLARSRRTPIALAAGAYLLIRRDLYDAIGGHRAVAGLMVDDISIARAVKRAGGLLVPAHGERLVRLRMYHGAADLWRGWSKNASYGLSGPPLLGLAGALLLALTALTPPVATLAGVAARRPRTALWGLAGWTAQAALHRMQRRAVPAPPAYAPTFPLGAAVIAAAGVRGAVDRMSGRGAAWRGRRYPEAR